MEENVTSRLGVNDKRHLFASLIAMVDRLLFLNKFPVDQEDFALSCVEPEIEAAWRLLRNEIKDTLSPDANSKFLWPGPNDRVFHLHLYPGEAQGYGAAMVFMKRKKTRALQFDANNRFASAVDEWCRRQVKLENMILRTNKVIKGIIHSCNTIGQYREVSPDLITFLPERYQLALKDYIKRSPYPAMGITPEEIDTTMSTLAYAALQPTHYDEEQLHQRPSYHGHHRAYQMSNYPRSIEFQKADARKVEL